MTISPQLKAIIGVKCYALTLLLRLERLTIVKCLKIYQNAGSRYQTHDLLILSQLDSAVVVICYALVCFYHEYQYVVVNHTLCYHDKQSGGLLLPIVVKWSFVVVVGRNFAINNTHHIGLP